MKKIIASVVVAAILSFSHAVEAKFNVEKHTSPDGKYNYTTITDDPLGVRIYTLKNGLTVYLSVNKNEPRIQTMIAVRAGSKNDPADATGLAHYLEHLLFKGTDKFGSLDYSKEKPYLDEIENRFEDYRLTTDPAERKRKYHEIDSVSGVAAKWAIANEYDKMLGAIGAKGTNAFTWLEQTVYVNDIPSNQESKWLDIEAERYRHPVLRLFHTELEAVYEEKNRNIDNDGEEQFETMMRELFKHHTYGSQTTIGTVEHLKNPSIKKIEEYYNKYYVPNNMAIVLSGDLDPDKTIALIDEKFSILQPKPVPPFSFLPEEAITSPIRREVLGPDPENVAIGFRLPGMADHDVLVCEMIDKILSNNVAGLFDLDLNQQQKVLNAGTWMLEQMDYTLHMLQGNPLEGQKLEDVEALMLGELDKVKRGDFDEKLITAVVNDLTVQRIRGAEHNGSRASQMMEAFIHHLDWKNIVSQLDDMSHITKQEIMDVAKKYYGNNYVVVYKRVGQRNSPKVEKPAITPVQVNREAESPFVKKIIGTPADKISPRFLDYKKDIEFKELPGGVPLHYLHNSENQLFSMYYLLDFGAHADKKLAFATNYLNFLGTNTMSAEDVKKKLYALGLSLNVSASDDQIYVSLSGLQKSFTEGTTLLEEILSSAKPDADALSKLVASTLKSRADAKQDKGTILNQAMDMYGTYGKNNPFTNILSESELRALTADELVAKIRSITTFQHRVLYYGPENSTLILSALKKLHHVASPLTTVPTVADYQYQETNENKVYFVNFDMQQAEVLFFSKSYTYDPAKVPVQQLYNEYFGGGMSSVVFQNIRESKALAYAVWSSYITPPKKSKPNYIFAYVGTQADKLPETMDAMFDLFENMPRTDKIFDQSKDAIRNKIATERITREQILFNYESAQKKGLDHDIRQDVYNDIPSMDFSKISDFQKQYIKDHHYTIMVLGKRDKVDLKSLEKWGPVKELSLEEVFGY
ncbi:MAG TPA: insulinase family protein [Candidatus Kapabacteria bacterium]|nr:insulinase family protein [Candidatus Kapabacteria bacterium]